MDSITSFAVERIGDSVIQEVKFLAGVKEQVEEMKMELEWMQCFLEDADKNPISSRTFNHWVLQIKEANYKAEDTIDSFLATASLRKRRRPVISFIRRFAYFIIQCRELRVVGRTIQDINAKLSTLRSRLQTYGVMGLSVRENVPSSFPKQMMIMSRAKNQSFSFTSGHNVVGLEKMTNLVVEKLLNQEDYSVSIYGMGGLGKTTLAKKVYHHNEIRNHFTNFAWIYVPQQFKKRELWAKIVIQLTSPAEEEKKRKEKMEERELRVELQKICEDQQKKCLVVVDGVRSNQDWESLFDEFEKTKNRHKMLLVTRKKEVAERPGFLANKLPPLSEKSGWKLLNKILAEDLKLYSVEDRQKREKLGKEMLKHCKGLPLAIVLLGGILSMKSLWEWGEVLDNIQSLLRRCGNNDQWFGVLVLSYHDLPNWLKPCFLYLSQFPEEHEIQTKQLLRMWMAEGLIYTSNDDFEEEEIMENVAERNLNELANRYMIQVKEEGSTGRIKTCGMHSIIRDMCLWKAKQEKFVHIVNLAQRENETMDSLSSSVDDTLESSSSASSVSNITNVRRLAIFADKDVNADLLSQNPHLRSFACFSHGEGTDRVVWKQTRPLLKNFRFLRVLVLEGVKLEHEGLSKEIGTLICLGYLSLKGSLVKYLASFSLEKLVCLETLDLRYCCGFEENQVTINWKWKMEKLRHLYLPKMKLQILQLHNLPELETLVNFHPKDFEGFRELMIRKLIKLKKLTLRIDDMGKVGNMFRKEREQVVFSHLQSLCLKNSSNNDDQLDNSLDLDAVMSSCPNLYKLSVQCRVHKFPESASQFSPNLTKIHLKHCELGQESISPLGKLPNLTILLLECKSFSGEELLFVEKDFPQLKHLGLDDLVNLREWTVDAGAMPSLCRLEINWCRNLRSVPDGLRYVVNLKEIEIRGMPIEFRRRLQPEGADRVKVKHVRSISFVDCDDGDD